MKKELDCRNLQCPEPVIRSRALVKAEHPDEFAVLVDNAAALENVTRFLASNGYEASGKKVKDNEWRIEATKKADQGANPASEEGQNMKTLILITTETLGRGDEKLGRDLMENFLSTLPEMGPDLWRIILLNGGVKLAAQEKKAIEILKGLEAAGIGIFVCGTCLMSYGLLEQKQVGETTNMLDVVTSLAMAEKVIRP